MGQIGEILKAAREKKGISISQAEEETKIRTKYLEALENETFDDIPGRVYVKGFLSNYAGYLGLDSQEMVQLLKESLPAEEAEIEVKKQKPVVSEKKFRRKYKFRPKYFRYILGILAIITLFVFNSWWHNNRNTPVNTNNNKAISEKTDKKDTTNTNQQKDNTKTTDQNKAQQNNQQTTPPPAPAPVTGAHLVLNADKGLSWISVSVDGVVAFEGNINQGETKQFDGKDNIKIRLGNAGAVNVTFNNENKGYLGAVGQVVDQQFTQAAATGTSTSVPNTGTAQ